MILVGKLEDLCLSLLGFQGGPVAIGGVLVEAAALALVDNSERPSVSRAGAVGVGAVDHVSVVSCQIAGH